MVIVVLRVIVCMVAEAVMVRVSPPVFVTVYEQVSVPMVGVALPVYDDESRTCSRASSVQASDKAFARAEYAMAELLSAEPIPQLVNPTVMDTAIAPNRSAPMSATYPFGCR